MKFSAHIDKAFWTALDKVLTVAFGFVFMKVSLLYLPVEEWGIFSILYNAIFLLLVNLGSSFALQPLMKFAAETEDTDKIVSVALILNAAFMAVAIAVVLIARDWLALWFASNASEAASIQSAIAAFPLLAAAFFFRNFLIYILQAKYHVIRILIIDGIYFACALGLMAYAIRTGSLATASDLFSINIYAYAISSFAALILSARFLKLRWDEFTMTLKKFWNFGSYGLIGSVGNNIYEQIDHYIIISLLTPRELGVYAAAKIFLRVFSVFTQIIQNLLIPVLSRQFARNAKEIVTVIFEKAVCFSTLSILPLSLIYLFLPELLFGLITKSAEFSSGPAVIRWSALMVLIVPWSSAFGCVYVAANQMRLVTFVNLYAVAINAAITWLMVQTMGVQGAVVALLISSAGFNFVHAHLFKVRNIMTFSWTNVIRRVRDVKNFFIDLAAYGKI